MLWSHIPLIAIVSDTSKIDLKIISAVIMAIKCYLLGGVGVGHCSELPRPAGPAMRCQAKAASLKAEGLTVERFWHLGPVGQQRFQISRVTLGQIMASSKEVSLNSSCCWECTRHGPEFRIWNYCNLLWYMGSVSSIRSLCSKRHS